MRLKILFHDNCFDGAASAAIFQRFYQEKIDPAVELAYQGVQHKQGDPFGPSAFDADVNVCVDFRYSQDARLTWWFDHHVSAFGNPGDREHFERDTSGTKFYDPQARSNTKFEADVLSTRFGFDAAPLADLIAWADVIDGAQFENARVAVELEEPALRLMTWVENNKDWPLKVRFINDLATRPLADIAAEAYVKNPLEPILEKHARHIATIRERAREEHGVVTFDLIDAGIDAHNKFIAYMLFPECRYTVGLTRSPGRVKVSVGSNPWARTPRTHDIARICERWGGGGHAVVGAISLPPGDIERGRQIARTIADELSRD